MKKIAFYIPVLLLIAAIIFGCTKTTAPVISPQIDQAFIQDIVVLDTAGKDVSVTKTFQKPTVDPVTGLETLGAAQANPINVVVTIKPGTDKTKLNVRFVLSGQSKNATVSPVLGYLKDFTSTTQYTITSLTGANKNIYAVQIGY